MEITNADLAYKIITEALDEIEWKYERHDEDRAVTFGVDGEDLPMKMHFLVNEELGIVYLGSALPLTFPEDKRIDGAIAVTAVNNKILDGYYFDYSLEDGEVHYVSSTCYKGGVLGKETIHFILTAAIRFVEDFNDKFFMLSKGMINISQFLESLNEQ